MRFLSYFKSSADRAVAGFVGLMLGASLVAAVAQGVILVVQNGGTGGPSIYGIGDPTTGLYFGTGRIGLQGHLESGSKVPPAGNVPVASICGAQPVAGSTDMAGSITNIGTTTCTLTFGTAYTVAPSCIVLDGNVTHAIGVVISASAITITGGTAADTYNWICVAKSGG